MKEVSESAILFQLCGQMAIVCKNLAKYSKKRDVETSDGFKKQEKIFEAMAKLYKTKAKIHLDMFGFCVCDLSRKDDKKNFTKNLDKVTCKDCLKFVKRWKRRIEKHKRKVAKHEL